MLKKAVSKEKSIEIDRIGVKFKTHFWHEVTQQ